MEESNDNGGSKKRVRVDSDESASDAGESKHTKVEAETDELPVDSVVAEIESSEPAITSNDILEILDDQDATAASDADIPDLDSVIRSFEEEILHPEAVDQPDLGYLLEASDDELGLPPVVSSPRKEKTKRQVPCYDSFGFENELPGYESFEYGYGDGFVNVDGLSEEWSDFSECLWRPETESLPAVR